MTIDQKDILETIDRLYAKAEKANTGGPAAAYEAAMLELHSALVGNWPALRDRLREAERRAKAFDAVARGDVGIGCRPNSNDTMKRDWVAYQLTPPRRCSNDLLTAIEAATREAKP